jgi:hypothetical protein
MSLNVEDGFFRDDVALLDPHQLAQYLFCALGEFVARNGVFDRFGGFTAFLRCGDGTREYEDKNDVKLCFFQHKGLPRTEASPSLWILSIEAGWTLLVLHVYDP